MPLAPFFTKENARDFAARGNAIRWGADARAKRIAERCGDTLERTADEAYRDKRKLRVRAQLDLIDRRILTERDPMKIDRLASAQARLSEQERQLSGRSMPPTVRATQEKPGRRRSASFEPEAQSAPMEPIPPVTTPPEPTADDPGL